MRLQPRVEFLELAVDLRHFLFHVGNRFGRADAGHHVLALGIGQVFTVDHVFAGAGVAREADASARVGPHVAKHHRDDIHGRAAGHLFGNLELAPVVNGAFAVPGPEHGADGDFELLVRIFRERLAGVAADDRQELGGQLGQMLGLQIDVLPGAIARLDHRHRRVKMLVANAQRDLAEQLDKTAPGIVAKARVAGLRNQALERALIQPQVEDGVHHARHRHGGTGAHRHQQRLVGAAKGLAGFLLQCLHVRQRLLHCALGQTVFFQERKAGVGAEHKTGRHIQADLCHFAQVRTLATEQHLVLAIALFERKYPWLFHHCCSLWSYGWIGAMHEDRRRHKHQRRGGSDASLEVSHAAQCARHSE